MTEKKPIRSKKISDTERVERFKDMAKEVDASEDPKDFDKAFKRVVPSPPAPMSK